MQTNIAPWERIARVVLGLIVTIGAGAVVLRADAFGYRVFAVVVVLLGVDFVVTGARGFCPLYAKLGRHSLTPRRAPHA